MLLPLIAFGAAKPADMSARTNQGLSTQANRLRNRMHDDAYQAQRAADHLYTLEFNYGPDEISWEAHADVLGREARLDNRMDRILVQLRTMEEKLPANQQAEIKAITPAVIELTDSTQSAMVFLGRHENELFLHPYRQDVQAIDHEAHRVAKETANFGQRIGGLEGQA
jgi:hypothetical protein